MGVTGVRGFEILVDMDSTAYDLTTEWLNWYNEQTGDNLTFKDVTDWDWVKFIKPEFGLKIYDFLHIEGMFLNLRPFDGAVEAMREVHEMGIIQRFASTVSTRVGSYEKQMAVDRDFPFIGKKRVLTTGGDKAFQGDLLVDDGPHNLLAFEGLTCKVDLQGCTYARDVEGDFLMTSWSQYVDIVKAAVRRWRRNLFLS